MQLKHSRFRATSNLRYFYSISLHFITNTPPFRAFFFAKRYKRLLANRIIKIIRSLNKPISHIPKPSPIHNNRFLWRVPIVQIVTFHNNRTDRQFCIRRYVMKENHHQIIISHNIRRRLFSIAQYTLVAFF